MSDKAEAERLARQQQAIDDLKEIAIELAKPAPAPAPYVHFVSTRRFIELAALFKAAK